MNLQLESQEDLIVDLASELQEVNRQLKEKTDAYDALKAQFDAECILHARKAAEVRALENMNIKDDEVSLEEISRALKSINGQILAIAKACSDPARLRQRFGEPKARVGRPEGITNEMTTILEKILGGKLLLAIEMCNFEKNQTILQLSMQNIICFLVKRCTEDYPFSPTKQSGVVGNAVWEKYPAMHMKGERVE